jgi:PAS domain S-box-containing protein
MNNESNNGSLFPARSSLWRNVLWIAAAALIYFGVARLSLLLIFQPQGITVIWPTSGIFLSAILLTRRELRPWLVAVLFVTDFIAERLAGTPGLVSLFFALALTADAVLSSWLLLHFVGGRITFKRVRELAGWLLLSVLFSNALTSLVAAAAASRFLPETSFWNFWAEWAVSDGVGNLIITPLVLSWAAWGKIRLGSWKLKRVLEGAVLVILLAFVNYIAFDRLSDYGLFSLLLSYLTFPFLLWAAWRFGVRGAASTALILAGIAIYFAFGGHFINVAFHDSTLQAVIAVQLYLAILAVPALFLAAVLTERNKAEENIEKANRLYRVLSNINQAIVRLREPEALYQEACRIAVEQGGFRMAWIGFLDEETEKVKPVAQAGIVEDYLDKLDVNVRDEEKGRGPTGTALREGHYEICNDIEHQPCMKPWRADALRLGYRSSAGFPLWVSSNVRGVITLYASEPNFFDGAEIKLLEELAQDISFAMEFAEQEQQRKQTDEKLKEERMLLRTLIDNLPDVIYVKDAQGRKIIANIADWQASGGKTMEDVVGKTDFELYPTEMAKGFWAIDKQVIDSGKAIINIEEPGFDSRGKQVWVLTSKVPLHDSQGNVIGLVGVGRDISERKQAQETLSQSEEKYRNLFNNSEVGMFRTRLDGSEILEFNERYLKILGYTVDDVTGKPSVNMWADKQERDKMVQTLKAQGQVSDFECVLLTKQGEPKTCITSLHLFPDQGILEGSILDITDRKQAEKKLKEYSEHLEEMVNERTRDLRDAQEKLIRQEKLAVLGQLAGGVGHELRNPLGVINTSIYYLKLVQPDANEKIKQHHAMIEQEVHNAEKIITDLLDFARIKSVDRELVSVSELLQRVLNRFPVHPSVEVILKLPDNLPKVFADSRQMEQVFGNLVVNAWQAMVSPAEMISPKGTMSQGSATLANSGKLTISASHQNKMVAIAVKDTGAGITPENMRKIFEPLFTTKAKGIGLGLAVSKKLVEANEGRIEVESELGKGSTFTVYLPEKQ